MMSTDPDTILLQDTYDLEQVAEAMIDRYYVTLHYLAYSILGDVDEADDAVQRALLRFLGRIDDYRPGNNMKAWLSSILINQCRDMIRRRKARQRLTSGLQWIFAGQSPQKSPEERTVKEEARSTLWSEVDNLGEKHRLPIILRYVHNLSVAEIAQILQIRDGTVHSRLHYACRKLERQLMVDNCENLVKELFHE